MYDAHGWFKLRESASEEGEDDLLLEQGIAAVRAFIDTNEHPNIRPRLEVMNGTYYVLVDCDTNRRTGRGEWIDELLAMIATRLPGSFGLLYELDDEAGLPAAADYTVTVLTRGRLSQVADPFLSPLIPTTED
jgi:hypothetical protein